MEIQTLNVFTMLNEKSACMLFSIFLLFYVVSSKSNEVKPG